MLLPPEICEKISDWLEVKAHYGKPAVIQFFGKYLRILSVNNNTEVTFLLDAACPACNEHFLIRSEEKMDTPEGKIHLYKCGNKSCDECGVWIF